MLHNNRIQDFNIITFRSYSRYRENEIIGSCIMGRAEISEQKVKETLISKEKSQMVISIFDK